MVIATVGTPPWIASAIVIGVVWICVLIALFRNRSEGLGPFGERNNATSELASKLDSAAIPDDVKLRLLEKLGRGREPEPDLGSGRPT